MRARCELHRDPDQRPQAAHCPVHRHLDERADELGLGLRSDGVGTSTAKNPSHIYADAGSYTVTLTATNVAGGDDETKTNYIIVSNPPPPVANFTGTPTSGTAPLTVQFTDTSTNAPTSWAWDFDNNGSARLDRQEPELGLRQPGDLLRQADGDERWR